MKKISVLLILVIFFVNLPVQTSFTAYAKDTVSSGAFQDVSYKLKPGVEMLNSTDFNSLKRKGNSLNQDNLPASVKKGFDSSSSSRKIFISEDWSDCLSLMSEAATDGSDKFLLGDPTLLDVFDDINIPDQTVFITPENVEALGKGISITSKKKSTNSDPKIKSYATSSSVTPYGFSFKFTNAVLHQEVDGVDVSITLNGSLDLDSPHIEGKYTKFSGYKMVLKTGETINLKASTNIDIDDNIKIPIGTPFIIPAGVGKASIGLYVVLRMDGSIALSFEMNQHFSVEAGVKGGTWFYIPTGMKKVFNCEKEFNTNASFMGEVQGVLGIAPIVSLRFAGMDVLYLETLLGMKANIKVIGEDVDVKAGVLFKVSGEVMDNSFTLVNYYMELMNYKERYTGKYKVKINEACAYQGLISGVVEEPDANGEYVPYKSGKVTLRVTDEKGKKKEYPNITIKNGRFSYNAVLKRGYKVEAKVAPTSNKGTPPGYSTPVAVTFPFDEIHIDVADYFNQVIQGNISTKALNVSGSESEAIKELAYNGPVKIIVKQKNHSTNSNDVYSFHIQAVNGVFSADAKEVADLDRLTPESEVSAVIEQNGFSVKIDNAPTDGLIFYPFVYYIEKQGKANVGGEPSVSYSSKGMKFYVANRRSEDYPQNTPEGDILVQLAVAFPHLKPGVSFDIMDGSTQEDEELYAENLRNTVPEFNTVNLVYKKVPLEKVDNREGAAIAVIEDVSVTIGHTEAIDSDRNSIESPVNSTFDTNDLADIDIDVDSNNADYNLGTEVSAFTSHDLTHYIYSFQYLPYSIYNVPSNQFPFYFQYNKSCLIEKLKDQQDLEKLEDKASELDHYLALDIKSALPEIKQVPGGLLDAIDVTDNGITVLR